MLMETFHHLASFRMSLKPIKADSEVVLVQRSVIKAKRIVAETLNRVLRAQTFSDFELTLKSLKINTELIKPDFRAELVCECYKEAMRGDVLVRNNYKIRFIPEEFLRPKEFNSLKGRLSEYADRECGDISSSDKEFLVNSLLKL